MANRTAKWNCGAALLVAGAVVLAVWLVNLAALAQGQGKTETLAGIISDTMCGAKTSSHGGDDKQCTIDCVKKMGAKYALVVGTKVYALEGKEADLEKLAGGKAKVTGTVQGTTLKVASVAAGS